MPAKHPLLVFQIQKQKRLDSALTGEGTRRTGGRWNQMDVPLIFASASPELAFLETFVHLYRTSLADLPPFVLLTLAVPTGALETVGPTDLPPGWSQRPYPDVTSQFLRPRLPANDPALAFLVSSVILPGSPTRNALINPRHCRMREGHIVATAALEFDERLQPTLPAELARHRPRKK